MTTHKPYAEGNGYTQIDNVIIDHIMPTIESADWKVLTVIIRKTRGWHKEADRISLSQLAALTGLSRPTATKSVARLESGGHIIVNRNGFINELMLNPDFEISTDQLKTLTSKDSLPLTGKEMLPVPSKETLHTKESPSKKNKKETTPLPPNYANMAAAEATHPEHIQDLIKAIAKVANKHPSLQTVAEAAYTLHDWGATGDEILKLFSGRGSWWLTHKDSPGVWGKSPTPNIGSIKSFFFQAREWEASDESKAAKVASDADQLHAAWIAPLKGMNGHAREHLMKAPENVRRAVQLAVSQREIGRAEHMTVELLRANLQMVAQV